MRTNTKAVGKKVVTHEGAPAFPHLKPLAQLRRLVLSTLLGEDQFYVDGKTVTDQIVSASQHVTMEELAALCVEARHVHHLRHVPLLLLTALIQRGSGNPIVASTIQATIGRADELAELLALYWKDGKTPLAKQLKRGLAGAFTKFSAYQLAKYNRDAAIKLRDVLFLCHAKPKDAEQAATWKALVDGTLAAPDTWEVELSAGKDKKATWERLLSEGKLGGLALLRNLRNMENAGVGLPLIQPQLANDALFRRVLPFRYVAAARAVPQWEPAIDAALVRQIGLESAWSGQTTVLVDVSGSMAQPLSGKSDLSRMDAAATLASVIPGATRVFTFSSRMVEVPPRKGMAGVDAIIKSQPHSSTLLGEAINVLNSRGPMDRLIVITDEQSHDRVPAPNTARAYMINVASYENGVGYGPKWTHMTGFSEGVLRFIEAIEKESA